MTALRDLRLIATLAVLATPAPAGAATLDGATLQWPWALPFFGLLLTIAAGPLLFARFWHRHYGKIVAAWSVLVLAAVAAAAGPGAAWRAFVHAMLGEYLGFIVLLFALYTVAGGILVTGKLGGTPWRNTAILALGTAMASFVGTTGAAMILIRPLIRANEARRHNVHVVIFFIFLVANIGGALTPLGDPPLFVGFLHGVSFFWPIRTLLLPTLLAAALVLAMFFCLDALLARRERAAGEKRTEARATTLAIRGVVNIPLVAAIIAAILISAAWNPGITLDIQGTQVALPDLARDGALLAIALLSVWLTPEEHRAANGFSWEPIREVAKLFAAIFICIIPALAMLKAGRSGAFAWLLNAVTTPEGTPHVVAYFWLTGALSAFLDNAPTYLVFFELAGGDSSALMGPLATTLAAISMGAVYLGAMTYIGNAPNLMVQAIARERGIKMPSFFGYVGWSVVFLVPVFLLLTLLFVRAP
jgi:Na+/H+ antiporter NhaD/arsenite permease-like protein